MSYTYNDINNSPTNIYYNLEALDETERKYLESFIFNYPETKTLNQILSDLRSKNPEDNMSFSGIQKQITDLEQFISKHRSYANLKLSVIINQLGLSEPSMLPKLEGYSLMTGKGGTNKVYKMRKNSLEKYTIQDLKEKAKKRNINVSGLKKAEIIAKLRHK